MRSILLAAILILASGAVFAQSDRSTINGTISDPAGAVVAGAPVVARNQDTGVEYQGATTGTGKYSLPELPAGRYELSVAVPGFKKYVRQGLGLQAAQTYGIDVTLEVGSASESVTVTEAAPLLKTESGELAHNVSNQTLDNLPILGIGSSFASNSGIRNPLAATNLVPGGIFSGDTTVRLNGTPQNTQSLRIEGQESSNLTMAAFASQNQPSVDSIQEFQIQTSNYAAEFGQAGGGVFIATMKSGTNALHGSLYDYFVNDALNASTPFTNQKPRAHRNDYGFTVGGPVKLPKLYDGRNRSFFFYNFEQFRENTVVNNVPLTVPTPEYRAGNFGAAPTGRNLGNDPQGRPIIEGNIYDPNTNHAAPNGQIVRDLFPNNVIPANRLDPVALAIQSLVPQPLQTGLVNNYLTGYVGIRHTDINSIKFDQTLSGKQKFSVFYSRTHTYSPYSQVLAGDALPKKITVGRGNYDWVHNTRINYDYTLTPTMLVHVGAGYTNQHGPNDFTEAMDTFNPSEIGLKGVGTTGRFPSISNLCTVAVPAGASSPVVCGSTGGLVNLGPGTAGGNFQNTTGGGIYSFRPSANASTTWIHGNHTYKAGAEAIVGNFMYAQDFPGAGQFNFSTGQTGLPYTAPSTTVNGGTPGFNYASFLLGAVDNGAIGLPTDQHFGQKLFALFVQDSWKVTRKLTIDYGVRWDDMTYLREGAGRMPSFSPITTNPTTGLPGALVFDGNLPGRCNCNFASNYPYAIGPRLGAAYQITAKTVLRAGFGVVYARPGAYDNITVSGSTPFSSNGLFTPAMTLGNGVPVAPNPWPNFNPGQFPNATSPVTTSGVSPCLCIVDPNAGRPPRQLQWSVGLQREVMRNVLVEASYVGNRGAWWVGNPLTTYNAISPATLAARGIDINNTNDRALLASTLSSTTAIQRGFGNAPYASFPLGQTVAQSLRPYPAFGNITAQWAPLGDTWYNSFQLKVIKRLSHGLDASYSLAWQKSLTMGAESEGAGGGQVNDVFNRRNSKYLSQFDQPLVSIIGINYTTPRPGSTTRMTGKILSWIARDWTLGSLLQYRSGTPILAPVATTNLATYVFQNTFFNRVPGVNPFTADLNCHCIDPNKQFVLNPAAWTNPPVGQFGTSAAYYDDYRYQRRPTENLNFGRTFRVRERMSLNIRAEFSNVLNRTYMSNPTSNNALATQTTLGGKSTGGFGYINTGTVAALPRNGSIVARITF